LAMRIFFTSTEYCTSAPVKAILISLSREGFSRATALA
jgi:hypothetical protein